MTKHAPLYDLMIIARQPDKLNFLIIYLFLEITKISMIQYEIYLFIKFNYYLFIYKKV